MVSAKVLRLLRSARHTLGSTSATLLILVADCFSRLTVSRPGHELGAQVVLELAEAAETQGLGQADDGGVGKGPACG